MTIQSPKSHVLYIFRERCYITEILREIMLIAGLNLVRVVTQEKRTCDCPFIVGSYVTT